MRDIGAHQLAALTPTLTPTLTLAHQLAALTLTQTTPTLTLAHQLAALTLTLTQTTPTLTLAHQLAAELKDGIHRADEPRVVRGVPLGKLGNLLGQPCAELHVGRTLEVMEQLVHLVRARDRGRGMSRARARAR